MLCCLILILFFTSRERKSVHNKKFCPFTCYCWLCHIAGSQLPFKKGIESRLSGKEPAWQCRRHRRHRFNPWVGKTPQRRKGNPSPVFPGGGNGNPLQCSSLDKPMDRGAWQPTVHGVAKSRTRPSLHTRTHGSESPQS